MSKLIPLTQGQFAIVDDEDFERVSAQKWHITWQKHRGLRSPYAQATFRAPKRTVMMHRFVMNAGKDHPTVDHKDHNGLNNQKDNLRFATRSENRHNSAPPKGTRLKGIQNKGHQNFVARLNGKIIGHFKTESAAIIAYNESAKKFHGEFAYLNPITEPA